MDTYFIVLSDAILLAERIQYADDFVKTGYCVGQPPQHPKGKQQLPKGAGPMEIDAMKAQPSGKPRGKSPFIPRVKQ